MNLQSTHTLATMELSPQAYHEIRQKLLDAGYHHAIGDDSDGNLLDLTGISVVSGPVAGTEPPTTADMVAVQAGSWRWLMKQMRESGGVAITPMSNPFGQSFAWGPPDDTGAMERKLEQARSARDQLAALIDSPEIEDFLLGTKLEAAHQKRRWGAAHDRSKSAENWFWLVGYLASKALRAAIAGDKTKGRHHCISTAAALYQWHQAITSDTSGAGVGKDADLTPDEAGRKHGEEPLPVDGGTFMHTGA